MTRRARPPTAENAAAIWGKPTDEAAALRLIDVLRRAGDIPAARAAADAMPEPADEAAQRILAFQRVCLDAADTGRHLISSALRPPARTPHVLHGRETRPGPVSRWLRWSRRGS